MNKIREIVNSAISSETYLPADSIAIFGDFALTENACEFIRPSAYPHYVRHPAGSATFNSKAALNSAD